MTEAQMIAHVTQLHEAQQKKRVKEDVDAAAIVEKEVVTIAKKEVVVVVQAEASTKVTG